MDNNGVDELILADGNGLKYNGSQPEFYTMQIWTYDNGSAKQLYNGDPFYADEASVEISLIKHDDYIYAKVGMGADEENNYSFYGYDNGSFGEIKNIEILWYDDEFVIDGETVSQDELNAVLDDFVQHEEEYGFIYSTDGDGITTTENFDSYYTNDPDKIKEMIDDVRNTCNGG
jgi:hypothetical protein